MREIKRIIIKIGSSSLIDEKKNLLEQTFIDLAQTISALSSMEIKVILVTSGAIAIGRGKLKLNAKPQKMALKQACAALGQVSLMKTYEHYFEQYNLICAQILVNHDDFENRLRMNNLRNTLEELFANNIIPIINENDALAVEEISVGDNDTLASLLVPTINADLLVLASDIDGLYDKNPKQYSDAKKVEVVQKITKEIEDMVGEATTNLGTGGMETKIKAARIATSSGCNMAIISSTQINDIIKLVKGEQVGTLFISTEKPLRSHDHWLIYHAYAKGNIIIDEGAKDAIIKNHKSLLPSGITAVEGHFLAQSVVFIIDQDGKRIAKGITNYSSDEIRFSKGQNSNIAKNITNCKKSEVVHCDNLLIIDGENYGKLK